MEIRAVTSSLENQYTLFLKNHKYGSVFQSLLWKQYQQKAFHRDGICLVGTNNGSIINSVLFFAHPIPFRKTYLYAPRGPLFSDNSEYNNKLMNAVAGIGQKYQSIFFLFDPPYSRHDNLQTYLDMSSIKPSKSNQPQTTLLINLTESEESILAHMKEKGRYNIRLAERKGVVVRKGTIDQLYPLLHRTAKRDHFHIHAQGVYHHMIEILGDHALVLIAQYNNTIIAGGIFTYFHDVGTYYYGASSDDYRNVMAPYLVQWKAIQEARKRGCHTYDFLGIAEDGAKNHPWASVTEFKRKFGGTPYSYTGAFSLVFHPIWTYMYHFSHR